MYDLDQRFPWECRTYHPHEVVVPWLEENIGEFDQEWYRYGTDIALGIVAGVPLYDYYRFRDESKTQWGDFFDVLAQIDKSLD